ncbi:tripartite motif-containing protein 2-like [Mytilus edulis]|uniref:tripartite motif-containing protein 2-like n=1 Tax=Mytilus edulis TaxID=6550 RepID=UPI0039EE9F17
MASSKPIPCGPCIEGKVTTKADIWCYNCDEGLCSTCSGHHKRYRLSRDHTTVDIKSYNPSVRAIKTECDKHGQQLNLYCPSHLMPCCDECISNSHSKCMGIKSLASIVEITKIEKKKKSVEKDVNSILHILDKIVNNKSQNIKRGEQEHKSIKEFIVKIRNEIDEHLTHLEKKIYQEADTILNQEKSKATDLIAEIEGKQKNLKKMQDQLHTVIPHASKLKSFLVVHQIEQQVHQCQRYIDDLDKDDRAKEFNIKMEKNNETEKIIKKLGSLGELTVVKSDMDLNTETGVRREAQVESQEQSNINNMTINIERKIKINIGNISDMICLMDGRLIIVGVGDKVNLLTPDGKLLKKLPIPSKAWSVTQINQDTIALTYPTEIAIKIFNMENETVTKVITLDKDCWGLSSSDDSLVVGLSDDEIRIIDLDGNTLKSIQVKCKSDLKYLVYCNDRVIYSDYFGEAVYCVDQSGQQIWQYKQDLSGPRGLCTDTNGNIIVADYNSHRIIVISKDGKESKVLLSDGLECPRCICLKHCESSGFICDVVGKNLTKFNFSSK